MNPFAALSPSSWGGGKRPDSASNGKPSGAAAFGMGSPITSSRQILTHDELKTHVLGDQQYEYPSCEKCHQGWAWPRNLRYVHVSSEATAIKPRTKNTIVPYLGHNPKTGAPLLPPELFAQLHLVFSRKLMPHALVNEFKYSKKTGEVGYERMGEDDLTQGYARLITLNAWWRDLARAIIQVTINVGDITSNLLFIAEMVNEGGELLTATEIFALFWMTVVMIWFICAMQEASKEWLMRTHPNIGDITLLPGAVDAWWSYGCLVLFFFAGIETLTRDIVIYVHPWKGVQPFAALKTQGTRAFVVGFPDYVTFKTEIHAGQIVILPLRITCTLMAFLFKILIIVVENKNAMSGGEPFKLNLFMLGTLSTSIFSMAYNFRKWLSLRRARREFRIRQAAKAQRERESQNSQDVKKDWRDDVFYHRHFNMGPLGIVRRCWAGCLSHFRDRSKKQSLPAVEGCTCCGRVPDEDSLCNQRQRAGSFHAGQVVTLVKDYKKFLDAKHGPLKPGDLGVVVQTGEFVMGYGQRVLVRPCARKRSAAVLEEFNQKWWYDACAFRAASGEDKFGKGPRDEAGLDAVHDFANELKASSIKLRQEISAFADEFSRKQASDIIMEAMDEGLGGLFGNFDGLRASSASDPSPKSGRKKSTTPRALDDLEEQAKTPLGNRRRTPSEASMVEDGTVEVGDECDDLSRQRSGPLDALTEGAADRLEREPTAPLAEAQEADAVDHMSIAQVETPREAAMRLAMEKVIHSTPPPRDFKHLRYKITHTLGKKRIALAILCGQPIHKPETSLLLRQLAQKMSEDECITQRVVVVTSSLQGAEQKFVAHCSSEVEHCHLTARRTEVHYTRDHDFVAGDTYVDIREALINVCDIFVVVEGGTECAEDARAAHDRGARLIPVKKYGGAGGGRHGFPQQALDPPEWAEAEDWGRLADGVNAQATADGVFKLMKQAMDSLARVSPSAPGPLRKSSRRKNVPA